MKTAKCKNEYEPQHELLSLKRQIISQQFLSSKKTDSIAEQSQISRECGSELPRCLLAIPMSRSHDKYQQISAYSFCLMLSDLLHVEQPVGPLPHVFTYSS